MKDADDGTISLWEDQQTKACDGVKLNGRVSWRAKFEDGVIEVKGENDSDTKQTSYVVTYPPKSKKKGFTGHAWYVRD